MHPNYILAGRIILAFAFLVTGVCCTADCNRPRVGLALLFVAVVFGCAAVWP